MSEAVAAAPWMPRGGWFGQFDGSMSGKLFVEFTTGEGSVLVVVVARSEDEVLTARGPLVTEADGSMSAHLEIHQEREPASASFLDLGFQNVRPGRLQGRWKGSSGDQGVFLLNPAEAQEPTPTTAPAPLADPLQIVQRSKPLPKLRLFRDDVREFAAIMKKLFRTPFEVVVNANVGGKEVRRLNEEFWSLPDLPSSTDSLTLSLTEPGPGLLHSITIVFDPDSSRLTVTGPEDVWVSGTFIELEAALDRRHSRAKLWYERHALNFNGLTLLLVLAYLPSLALAQRIVLLFVAVVLILVIRNFHNATTAVRVALKKDKKDGSLIELPRLLTTLAGAGITGAVTGLYYLLSEGALRGWLEWLIGLT